MADRWWVNDDADGDWNNANNWSATEGGAGGAGVPGASDNAYFSDTSSSDNCTLSVNISVASLAFDNSVHSGTDDYSGTFDANDFNLTIGTGGLKTASGMTLTMGSGTWSCDGTFDVSDAGTLTDETSVVQLESNCTSLVTKDVTNIYDLIVKAGASVTWTCGGSQRIRLGNDLTIEATASLAIDGHSSNNSIGGNNSTHTIDGTLSSASDSFDLNGNVTIGASGVLSGGGTCNWYEILGETFAPNTSATISITTLNLHYGNTANTQPAFSATANVSFKANRNGSGPWETVFGSGTFDLDGNVVFDNTGLGDHGFDFDTNNPDFEFSGDVTVQETSGVLSWSKGTGTITLTGTADQDIDFDGESIEDIVIDKSAGTVTLTGGVNPDNWTLTDGTLDIDGQTLTVAAGGAFTASAGTTVQDTTGTGLIVTPTLDLNGADGSPVIWTDADLNVSTSADADWCEVSGSDASAGTEIDATDNCTDNGGNTNWAFASVSVGRLVNGGLVNAGLVNRGLIG